MAVGSCEFCKTASGEEIEVLDLGGLGQRLRVKITARVIFQLMELDEESFSAIPEDNSVEALLERCSEDRLLRSFVSSSGKFLEVDFAENLE